MEEININFGDIKGEHVLVNTTTSQNGTAKFNLMNYLKTLQENEKNSNLNAEQLLKEFKNLPFVCISNEQVRQEYASKYGLGSGIHNTYNSAGRIKSMYFVQVIDDDYEIYK